MQRRCLLTSDPGFRARRGNNGEILSGQLVAPGLPEVAEKELRRSKMNSYGKTWHAWNIGHGTQGRDAISLGEPMLAWSLDRFGEAAPGLVASRDERMGNSTGGTPPAAPEPRRRAGGTGGEMSLTAPAASGAPAHPAATSTGSSTKNVPSRPRSCHVAGV
jgi:hypothetical protein